MIKYLDKQFSGQVFPCYLNTNEADKMLYPSAGDIVG